LKRGPRVDFKRVITYFSARHFSPARSHVKIQTGLFFVPSREITPAMMPRMGGGLPGMLRR